MAKETSSASLFVEELLQESTNRLKIEAEKKLEDIQTAIEAKVDGLRVALNETISTLESYTTNAPLSVNVGTLAKPQKTLVHSSFDTIIKILRSTKRKEKNIMLVGGAGGGKTHLVGTVAEALKLPFYPMSVGLQTTKSDLLGFINATGGYNSSIIRQAYEHGGVLLLDEFDSAHAGVVTILNSLLANGHCSFPDGVISKHKDFICLCACNTYGKGGNVDYVGRNRLDGATLDRFIIVDVDYDNKLEGVLTGNDPWLKVINSIRRNAESKGVKIIISPRASMDGADLLEVGFTKDQVLDMVVFKGCDRDVKTKLLSGVDLSMLTGSSHKASSKVVPTPSKLADIIIDYNDKEGTITVVKYGRSKSASRELRIDDCSRISFSNGYSFYWGEETLYCPSTVGKTCKLYRGCDKIQAWLNEYRHKKLDSGKSLQINYTKANGTLEELRWE